MQTRCARRSGGRGALAAAAALSLALAEALALVDESGGD